MHEVSALFSGEKSCAAQDVEMLGNGAFTHVQRTGERGNAVAARKQQKNDAAPGVVRQCAKERGVVHGIFGIASFVPHRLLRCG